MATPYLDEAERCGRIVLLHEGRVLAIDQPAALQSALAGRLYEVITETARPPLDLLRSVPGVVDAQGFGDRAHVTFTPGLGDAGGERIRERLAREGIALTSLRPIGASLEDVFIGMLGNGDSR